MPSFQEFRNKLAQIYKQFNKYGPQMIDKNMFLKMAESEKGIFLTVPVKNETKKTINKRLIYNPNKEEEIKCKNIYELFRKQMEEISSKILPNEPIFYDNENKVNFLDKYILKEKRFLILKKSLRNLNATSRMLWTRFIYTSFIKHSCLPFGWRNFTIFDS